MIDQGLVNLNWAHALVDGLAAAGLRRAVISPGSRSTPLVLACDRHPEITTRIQLDERAAAFRALGHAKADSCPTAVIATSGSAPSHWYPALLEASLSHTPLLLLSADRPPELQSWGANQTLDQQWMFGSHVRAFHQASLPEAEPAALRQIRLFGIRAVEQCLFPNPGPVHLNLPFREPLIPAAAEAEWPMHIGPVFPLHPGVPSPDEEQIRDLAHRLEGRPGMILSGPGPYPGSNGLATAVTELARDLNCPLLADPLSGLRFGPWDHSRLLTGYDCWLRRTSKDRLPPVDWILRLGAAPVSKALLQFLETSDAFQVLVTPFGDWPDPVQRSNALIRSDAAGFCRALSSVVGCTAPTTTLREWQRREADAQPELQQEADDDRPFEGLLIQDLLQTLPPDTTLFSGNSLPIRQLDCWSGSAHKPLNIQCNRGASGIDGNLATLAGIAEASSGPVVGLLGDLTLLHDLSSLAATRGLPLTIVVLNNSGGGIFGQLPQADLKGFEHYWLTPQGIDLAQAARLFDLSFRRVERQSGFLPALKQALSSPAAHMIEVVIDRDYSLRRHQAYWNTR